MKIEEHDLVKMLIQYNIQKIVRELRSVPVAWIG